MGHSIKDPYSPHRGNEKHPLPSPSDIPKYFNPSPSPDFSLEIPPPFKTSIIKRM